MATTNATMYFSMDSNCLSDSVGTMPTNSSQYHGHCQYQIDDSAMTNLEQNVYYSNDYSAHSSMMDLFKNAYKPKKTHCKRNENLPESFYDQFASTRSSSASHSRESSMDAIYNSPQRSIDSFGNQPVTINCLPPSMCKNRVRSQRQHPSNSSSTSSSSSSCGKQANCNLVPYHVKTSSLPASFAPSNETDSNNNSIDHDHCSNSNYNNNNVNNSQIRLVSFNQLQQNLMYNKSKATESRAPETIGNKKKPKSEDMEILQFSLSDYTATGNIFDTNSAALRDIHQQQVNAWARENYPSQAVIQADQLTRHNIQQLQSERDEMHKRRAELEQWNLTRQLNPLNQSVDIHRQFRSLGSLNNLDSVDPNQCASLSNIGSVRYRNPVQQHYHNQLLSGQQAPSPQESLDSGLGTVGYSSSFELSNCVTPETYLQANTGINVSNSNSATLNKMVTSVTDAGSQLSFVYNSGITLPLDNHQHPTSSASKKASTIDCSHQQQQPTNGTENQDASFSRLKTSRIRKSNLKSGSNQPASPATDSSPVLTTSATAPPPSVSSIMLTSSSPILSANPIDSNHCMLNAVNLVSAVQSITSPSAVSPVSPFSVTTHQGVGTTLTDNIYSSMSLGSSPVSLIDSNSHNHQQHAHLADEDGSNLMLSCTTDEIIPNPIMTSFYDEPFLSTYFNNDYENIFDLGSANFSINSNGNSATIDINSGHSPSHHQSTFLVETMSNSNGTNDRLAVVNGNDSIQFC